MRELRKCQATIGTGYLSAFPVSHFERLRSLQPVWAPFYVVGTAALATLTKMVIAYVEALQDCSASLCEV